jgi:hypothetical protein
MADHVDSGRALDAVEILRIEHTLLQQLFAEYFATRGTRRYDLIPCLAEAVERHMALDAEIFYPHLAQALGDERLQFGALAEYEAVKNFVDELVHPDPGDYGLSERVYRLSTMVAHHIAASESPDGAFAKALRSGMDGAAVGSLLRKRRQEWMLDSHRRHSPYR